MNAERLVLLSWPRAILLQFAHPLIAAGIHEHSQFRARPAATVQRLRSTVRAMLALTFGSPAERQETLDKIMAIHRRVRGTLPTAVGRFAAGALLRRGRRARAMGARHADRIGAHVL